jgi:hypothetical protein
MEEVKTKVCTKCKVEKNIEDFHKDKGYIKPSCKVCRNIYSKEYFNKEKAILVKNNLELKIKICTKCKIEKDINLFPKIKYLKSGYSYKCKDCSNELTRISSKKRRIARKLYKEEHLEFSTLHRKELNKQKNWRQKNPNSSKNNWLKTRYGITLIEYNEMLKNQNFCCTICKCKPERTLHLDHNHNNNLVRALLCKNCNNALGFLKESPELLRKSAEYLEFYIERHKRILNEI